MSNTLFILEGSKTEEKILDNLSKKFDFDFDSDYVVSYNTTIHSLYLETKDIEAINIDDFIINKTNNLTLKGKSFSQIYLFFDLDQHDPTYNHQSIIELLNYFNDETQNGKLFINYPMVESFYCFKLENVIQKYPSNMKGFKENYYNKYFSKNTNLIDKALKAKDMKGFNKDFKPLFNYFLFVAKHLVSDNFLNQKDIFEVQHHEIIANYEVVILSSFPLFIYDYFKENYLKTINLI